MALIEIYKYIVKYYDEVSTSAVPAASPLTATCHRRMKAGLADGPGAVL